MTQEPSWGIEIQINRKLHVFIVMHKYDWGAQEDDLISNKLETRGPVYSDSSVTLCVQR